MKKRTRITAKMEQKMQELRAQGKSAKEIAAVVGVSETAVRTHTTGIVVPEDEKQARVEAVRKMYTEGKTYTQIAAETGASASTIRNYTCDLPRRDRNRNGAPIPREKVDKIRKLRSQGKSFEAIARQMGIKPVTAKKVCPGHIGGETGAASNRSARNALPAQRNLPVLEAYERP